MGKRKIAIPPRETSKAWVLDLDDLNHLPPPVRRAVACIHEHYARPLPLSEIADAAGIGVRQMQRLFGRHLRLSPIEYLLNCRICRAIDLLRSQPSATVERLCLAVGYESASYFVGLFKRRTGCTVREYRERVLEAHMSEWSNGMA